MLNFTKALLLGSLLMACSVAPLEEEGETSDAIIDGTSDKGDPAVVAVFAYKNVGDATAEQCSGTVIAPRVVLTASHCVDKKKLGFRPAQILVATSHDFRNVGPGEVIQASTFISHPNFNPDPKGYVNDIAVVLLSTPLSVTPVPYNRTSIAGMEGQSARIVGYGRTIAKTAESAHEKRQGKVTLGDIRATDLRVDGPSFQCHGDSGGPLLKKIGGKEVIIGISSSGAGDTCKVNVLDTRIDAYVSFLDPIVKGQGGATSSSSSHGR